MESKEKLKEMLKEENLKLRQNEHKLQGLRREELDLKKTVRALELVIKKMGD